jgi:hypothetical protein
LGAVSLITTERGDSHATQLRFCDFFLALPSGGGEALVSDDEYMAMGMGMGVVGAVRDWTLHPLKPLQGKHGSPEL